MLLKLNFTGVILTVNKINMPKSKYVEYLNAKEGDKFSLSASLAYNRRYANYICVTNISDENNPSTTIPQEQFFNSFQRIFDLV